MSEEGQSVADDLLPEPHFISGSLWLDFVNTVLPGASGPVDLIGTPQRLLAWLQQAQSTNASQMLSLTKAQSNAVHKEAIALREAFRQLAKAPKIGAHSTDAAARINHILSGQSGCFQLSRASGRFRREFVQGLAEPRTVLLEIAEAAAGFLIDGDPDLLKKCASPICVLLFYDTTKNHSRLFCSSEVCGNRAKVAAHYRRRKTSLAAT